MLVSGGPEHACINYDDLGTLEQWVNTARRQRRDWPQTRDVQPTYSRDQSWIPSGSFDRSDRTVKLRDLSCASQQSTANPITTLTPPESSSAKASICACAVNAQGHMLVSGGPEHVVRMWDPRVGKCIGTLVAHTDNIRTIIISEHSRCCALICQDVAPPLKA
ncbi:hypothetical protein BC826DRAFT_265704 [Russula brevipes]|nr:hypothetical protein BC826DRAFT_265704 [Russula brevipes]